MKLYHFCAERFFPSIQKSGLTQGKIPLITSGKFSFISNSQWLTTNPDFNQEWNAMFELKYDRTAVRITVKIPIEDKKLVKWSELSKLPDLIETAAILNSYGDPENWWIYVGKVKPNWFREIKRKGE